MTPILVAVTLGASPPVTFSSPPAIEAATPLHKARLQNIVDACYVLTIGSIREAAAVGELPSFYGVDHNGKAVPITTAQYVLLETRRCTIEQLGKDTLWGPLIPAQVTPPK